MIDEKYKKSLTRFEGKMGKVFYWISLIGPLILLAFGILNLWMASRIGSAGGFALGDYINIWSEEINLKGEYSYSGIFLAGLHRFNTALLYFSFAVVLLPRAFGAAFERKRDQVISNTLRKHGEV